jgi:hypothetical protein
MCCCAIAGVGAGDNQYVIKDTFLINCNNGGRELIMIALLETQLPQSWI